MPQFSTKSVAIVCAVALLIIASSVASIAAVVAADFIVRIDRQHKLDQQRAKMLGVDWGGP